MSAARGSCKNLHQKQVIYPCIKLFSYILYYIYIAAARFFSERLTLQDSIYRILDVNFNRLREALRVIEEFFRFILEEEKACVDLKKMRHLLTGMEKSIGHDLLLKSRDTAGDCFAFHTRPEEMNRIAHSDVLNANFKRAQEASRVIEEYSKLSGVNNVSQSAKEIRFSLYTLQKTVNSVES